MTMFNGLPCRSFTYLLRKFTKQVYWTKNTDQSCTGWAKCKIRIQPFCLILHGIIWSEVKVGLWIHMELRADIYGVNFMSVHIRSETSGISWYPASRMFAITEYSGYISDDGINEVYRAKFGSRKVYKGRLDHLVESLLTPLRLQHQPIHCIIYFALLHYGPPEHRTCRCTYPLI